MKKSILFAISLLIVLGVFKTCSAIAAQKGGCQIRVNNTCFSGPRYIKRPLTKGGCEVNKEKYGFGTCNANPDYWASAVKACGGKDKLASLSDVMAISSAIHIKFNELDEEKIAQWGLEDVQYVWTNSEGYGSCDMERRVKECIDKRDPKTTDLQTQKERCDFITHFRGHLCAEDESGATAMDLKNMMPTFLRSGYVTKKRFEHLPFFCKTSR